MGEWTEFDVEANGLRLRVTRTGQGDKPVVVCAHGFTDDGLCWTPLARALEGEYDLILPDARGHGQSEAPAGTFTYVDLADDLAALIRALGLARPVVLGHSMGAVTAMLLAARYPELVRAVALEDPPAWWPPRAEPLFGDGWRPGARAWVESLQRHSAAELADMEHRNQPKWAADELPPWAASKLAFDLRFIDWARPGALPWPEAAARMTCPALLLTGDPALGAAVADEDAAALAAAVPTLRRAHVPGAGHNVRRDQFAAYLAALRPALAAWSAAGKG